MRLVSSASRDADEIAKEPRRQSTMRRLTRTSCFDALDKRGDGESLVLENPRNSCDTGEDGWWKE